MNTSTMGYIQFKFLDKERFQMLTTVFNALRDAKQNDSFQGDEYWLEFFDEEARRAFWWPTEQELQEWKQRWQSIPVPQRFTDPSLQSPWTFGSMMDAFKNGEFELISCNQISSDEGQLVVEPSGGPSGTGCVRVLVESFGFTVVDETE